MEHHEPNPEAERLGEWLSDFVMTFREEYEKLSDSGKKHVSNSNAS